ncbi:MAG: NAD(P)-dependent oxidoreductase [Elusimicrobiales bacterium]|nr:NAD(P)-dependent oxidoreductase [Elusimicrobiales bacterium]
METIAVTGGTGFVGTFLCNNLLQKGYKPRIITRKKPKIEREGLEYAVADYQNKESLEKALEGADKLIHLAAGLFCISKNEFFKANSIATSNLTEAAKAAGIKKIVYQSSLAAGGPALNGIPKNETMEDKPSSYYGASKLEGEKYIKNFGKPFVILRAPIVYGGKEAGVSVISDWVRRGLMVNAGSDKGKFSFIFVKDLVRAQIDALEKDVFNGGTFYVCEKQDYPWRDFINMMAKGMGRKPPIILNMPMPIVYAAGLACEAFSILTGALPMLNRDKAREAAGPDWTADASLWEKTAGWSDWTPLKEGIKLTFADDSANKR